MTSSTLTKILLLFSSTVLTALCAEVGARIWLHHFATHEQYLNYSLYQEIDSKFLRFQPHAYLDYALTPNFHSGGTSHNSLGYRGDEFPKIKPEGEFRIVALGGSITYDEDVEDNKDTHTQQLENILREQGYQHVRVINAGVPAYNSWESLASLQFRILDLSPDIVIHEDNNNDIHARLVPSGLYSGDDAGRRKSWAVPPVAPQEWSVFARILSRYLHYTRQVGLEDFVNVPNLPYVVEGYDARIGGDPMKVLDENPPIYFERNTRNMVAIEKSNGVLPMLVTYAYTPYFEDYVTTPHYKRAIFEHNDIYRKIAESDGVPFLDLQAVMPKDKKYFTDGRHNSALGARKKAELYAEFLTSHNLIPKKLKDSSH